MKNENTNESTALTVLQKNNFELAEFSEDMSDIIAEELDGLGTIPFDVIKIPAGGGLAFELPGESEDQPELVNEITGIIVDHHSINALWMKPYDGANEQPDCSSFDGKTAILPTGELKSCAECPYNEFGSARDGGKGKLCKNMHRIYILRSGEQLPMLLLLPPTSLANWKNYLGKKLVIKGKRPYQVLTKITLKREKNANGIAYSQAVFTKVADLAPTECATLKTMVESIKLMTRSTAMQQASTFADGAEERPEAASVDIPPVSGAEFTDITDEAVPF